MAAWLSVYKQISNSPLVLLISSETVAEMDAFIYHLYLDIIYTLYMYVIDSISLIELARLDCFGGGGGGGRKKEELFILTIFLENNLIKMYFLFLFIICGRRRRHQRVINVFKNRVCCFCHRRI